MGNSTKMTVDFNDLYATICKEKEIKPRFKAGKYNDLIINANILDDTDWKPLLYTLSKTTTLHYLKITTRNKYRRMNRESLEEINITKQPLLGCFFVTIRKLLFNSEILTSLTIDGFPFSVDSLNILSSGLAKCRILQNLGLTNCLFEEGYKGLEIVCRLVASHTGLLSLDLTGCEIDENCVECIAKMIKSLRLVRMGELWKQSLRYRHPDPETFPGLRRITLNKNQMGDAGFKNIANEILDDLWLKAIDLRDCGITVDSLQCISDVLRLNSVIQVLDLRDNNIPSDVVDQIRFILKGNNNEADDDYFSMNTSTTTLFRRNSVTSTLSTKKNKVVVEDSKKLVNRESSTNIGKPCAHFRSEDDLQRVNKLIDTVNRLKSNSIHVIKQPTSSKDTSGKYCKVENENFYKTKCYLKHNQRHKASGGLLGNSSQIGRIQQEKSSNKHVYGELELTSSTKCPLKPKTVDTGVSLKKRSKSLHGHDFQKKCVNEKVKIDNSKHLEIHRCKTMPLKPVMIKRKKSVC